jgi:hypothetical protein
MIVLVDNLTPAGFNGEGGADPAVALRFTAGYAHHTPSGVKTIFYNVFSTNMLALTGNC